MSKSNNKQIPLIRSLSGDHEEKKINNNNDVTTTVNPNKKFDNNSDSKPIIQNSPIKMTSILKEFKEYEEEVDIRDDHIFKKVCDKNNYADSPVCQICENTFGIFKFRKNCGFCGKAVCKSHLVKKRENPQNPNAFVKICEICEEKYLNKMILDDFFKKKKKKEEETREVEKKLLEIKQELTVQQNEYSRAQAQREENEKIYQEKVLLLSKNINKKKQQTDKIEEENKQLNDKDIAINDAIKEESNKTVEYKNELERLSKQCEDVTKELARVESEIKRLSNIITETEQKINMYKFNKDHKELRESNQNNSMLQSLISGAEGSLVDLHKSINKMQNSNIKDQPVDDKRPCCHMF